MLRYAVRSKEKNNHLRSVIWVILGTLLPQVLAGEKITLTVLPDKRAASTKLTQKRMVSALGPALQVVLAVLAK